MKKTNSIAISIMVGAVLGAVFMFTFLGYFKGIDNKDDIKDFAITDAIQYPADNLGKNDGSVKSDDLNRVADGLYIGRRNAIVQAAESVGSAVVSLSVIQVVETRNTSPFGSDFWDYFFMPAPSRKRQVLSFGSGILINPDGYILTNDHVVGGAEEIKVTLTNGREYIGRLVGTDPITDLAVVKIISDSSVNFPCARLGDSDDLIIGEWAIAIGNPFGYLLDDSKPTVTVGVISAIDRDIKPERGQKAIYRKMIQTDASINPGNSGGPLINALGEVIGINTFIFTSSRGSEGIGFAVPINRAKSVIADLLQYGKVVKTWIGIRPQALTAELGKSLGSDLESGIVIAKIDNHSPAERAGLKSGDIILAAGNTEIKTLADWQEISNYAKAERALALEINRSKKTISTVIVVEEAPWRKARQATDIFGLRIAELNDEVASYAGTKNNSGVMVIGADNTSWAGNWGLEEEDILRQIGKHKITNIDDYIGTMAKIGHGYKIVFMVERRGEIFFLQVRT